MDELFILLYRTAILWLVALLVFRMMGKRTLAKMGPFDFAVIIMIGEAVAIGMEDSKTPLINAIGITVLLGLLQYLLTWLNVRFRWLEKMTQGTSTRLIHNGHIDQHMLKKERVSNADLFMELRKNDVPLKDVSEARLEPTGDISVKKKTSQSSSKSSKGKSGSQN
ncbi:Protein of unknown function [Sulfobacillus thermosulfidooxidans DSM 9293]|uniref:YetF C-terminal domain-containing protein n=1 Tax=Sulfobacillus thermosulfidooxidans (strain DSM 9293 / VKM B-1269 / AT-1) TaxID=929705 RepID=A0A1W1W7A4_SULTA|nr:YetF domain-containing protein [Sulfobacillus thermosulfidooxidans]SMC02166.1 Protein of unknown function [Sulfobacillus thermosulfidooxidans DSM 9293]